MRPRSSRIHLSRARGTRSVKSTFTLISGRRSMAANCNGSTRASTRFHTTSRVRSRRWTTQSASHVEYEQNGTGQQNISDSRRQPPAHGRKFDDGDPVWILTSALRIRSRQESQQLYAGAPTAATSRARRFADNQRTFHRARSALIWWFASREGRIARYAGIVGRVQWEPVFELDNEPRGVQRASPGCRGSLCSRAAGERRRLGAIADAGSSQRHSRKNLFFLLQRRLRGKHP